MIAKLKFFVNGFTLARKIKVPLTILVFLPLLNSCMTASEHYQTLPSAQKISLL